MDLRTLLLVGLVTLGLLWLFALRSTGPGAPAPGPPAIVAIEFPEEIAADGEEVIGYVRFRDPDGDVVEARFEVVEATLFAPFRFDPGVRGVREGRFPFAIFVNLPQEVTLRVTLVDARGNESEPREFRFRAVGTLLPPAPAPSPGR